MTHRKTNRINALRNIAATRDSVAWGNKHIATNLWGNLNALAFAAVLIVCSIAVGCSSSNNNEKPQPINSNNQIPVTQAPSPIAPTPALQAENKPAPKKITHKKPATVNYTDKTYGVTFEYPRRYAIETGDAAADLLTTSPVPMNFVAPGGVALAAVELPETNYANTDFSSAFFNVSVHKALTAEQCNQFAVPMPKTVVKMEAQPETKPEAKVEVKSEAKVEPAAEPKAEEKPEQKTEAAPVTAASSDTTPAPAAASVESAKAVSTESQPTQPATQPAVSAEPVKPEPTAVKASTESAPAASTDQSSGSKLLLGDMELRATEAVSGEGTRQSDSKYFHIYQNGSCYEFALNVTTVASQDGLIKHVDRDKVFSRLEQILDTVKISPLTPETAAEAPTAPAAASPAQ